MSNRSKNVNRNRWNVDRNDSDYTDNDKNRNWERDGRRNTSIHQGNWNDEGDFLDHNYGLSDISQGSANYGHVDEHRGARYYGTGNYGGYFGGGSNENDFDRSRSRNDQNDNRKSVDERSYNSGNYGRGPRYGNSNIHGSNDGGRNYSGRNEGNNSGYGRDYNEYGRGGRSDWQTGNRDRYSRYGNERGSGDWDSDRDWWDKTTDEVSSWFGDEDAERRRDMDRTNGPHSGKGPKGYKRSDEKIKEDIDEKLYHDSFIDASDIDVTVSDGEVTLSGTVDNKQTKRRAEDCADRVSGVKDVSNHLKINYAGSSKSTSETGGMNSLKTIPGLSEQDQKLDQSKDLKRTANK